MPGSDTPRSTSEDAALQHDEDHKEAWRSIEWSNTTHRATHRAEGVQKWREPAVFPPKATVDYSVSACFAVRHIGASVHDGLVIAVALAGLVASRCPYPATGQCRPCRTVPALGAHEVQQYPLMRRRKRPGFTRLR